MNNTSMSPLLRNRIQSANNSVVTNPQPNSDLNAVYEDLKRHANEAKPNEAKAKLVNDKFIKRQIDAVKDTGEDCKNLVKAVKTGDVNDTQIGRINDVGMKVGAGLIAAFLALNAKNKKTAIMEFVGAATFLTSMSAWPKLFINLPAKLVHGFDIDKKYISAQNEKKDFFLDNQFIPWDVYSKEELAEIGKNTGIDINSPNGEEKIKRKMQKTALQNRTLWMATAGFATPLMTSMVCSVAEPYIEKGIIKSDFNKVRKITESNGVGEYIDSIQADKKAISKAQKELDNLFEGKTNGALDSDFFEKLASKLGISNVANEFKNKDDLKVISEFDAKTALTGELETVYKNSAKYDKESLINALTSLTIKGNNTQILTNDEIKVIGEQLGESFKPNQLVKALAEAGCDKKLIAKLNLKSITDLNSLNEVLSQVPLKAGISGNANLTREGVEHLLKDSNLTLADIRKLLSNPAKFNQEEVEQILKNVEVDNTDFISAIKTFDKEVASNIRAKASKYVKLINPVAGERSQSVFTKEYMDTVSTLFKEMGLTDKQVKEMLGEAPQRKVPEVLKEFFEGKANNPAEYKNFIENLYSKIQTPDEVANCVQSLSDNAKTILPEGENEFKALTEAMLGEGAQSKSFVDSIKSFLKTNTTNIETFKSKILLMSGLERRIQSGELERAFKNAGLVSEEYSVDTLTQLAREAIYSSSASNAANKFGMPNAYKTFRDIIFDNNAYDVEKGVSKQAKEGIEKAIKYMTKEGAISKEAYVGASNFSSQIKTIARSISNNKMWKKIFIPATLGLVAITLLVQPLFGNIKKEYPENNNGGNNK